MSLIQSIDYRFYRANKLIKLSNDKGAPCSTWIYLSFPRPKKTYRKPLEIWEMINHYHRKTMLGEAFYTFALQIGSGYSHAYVYWSAGPLECHYAV